MDEGQNRIFEGLMKLADFSSGRWDARRSYEWKVSIAIWTLLAAGIVFLRTNRLWLPEWIGLAVVFLHWMWNSGIYVANQNDRMKAYHFRNEAESVLKDAAHAIKNSPAFIKHGTAKGIFGFLGNWWHRFNFATTVLLVILAYLFPR